jgi:5-methylcytosine-specific restriction endonuclease McrA
MTSALNQPVLVLNRLWQAVHICTVRRAITLLCMEHALVVAEEEGSFATYDFAQWCLFPGGEAEDVVCSVHLRVRAPRIVLLTLYDRMPRKEVKFSRNNVFERDEHTCQYCRRRFDRKELNIDHVVPRHRGGGTTWENVVCSCLHCNRTKGNRTPEEARMPLLRHPSRPRWRPFVEVQFRHSYENAWRHFLDSSRWRVEMGEV